MNNLRMNKQLGTAWFTFFTKVRPWLGCAASISVFVEFLQYTDVYFENWWLLVGLVFSIIDFLLCILVFMKSNGDYVEFVGFVEKVLIFEIFSISFSSIRTFIVEGYGIGFILVLFAIYLSISYLLWYRLNMKYFEKRVCYNSSDYNVVDTYNHDMRNQHFCSNCGTKIFPDAIFCGNCGTKVPEDMPTFHLEPIEKTPNFIDALGWESEIFALSSKEIYARYKDEEEWTQDYRYLCYQELLRRQQKVNNLHLKNPPN